MRIAVVCGHYMPQLGYQEVYLSRGLARLGHEVTVFTSSVPSPNGKSAGLGRYPLGEAAGSEETLTVLRLPHIFSFGAKVLGSGLVRKITEYDPDLIILIGIAKVFGLEVLARRRRFRAKVISIFGDSAGYFVKWTRKDRLKSAAYSASFRLLKLPSYKLALKHCDRIVLNLPETEKILEAMLDDSEKSLLHKKMVHLRLGYDPSEFYYSPEARVRLRDRLGVSKDTVVFVTVTRMIRDKKLERVVNLVDALRSRGENIKYVMVGFLGDDYEREITQLIHDRRLDDFFYCYPLLGHEEIRDLYSASDIGIWMRAAISLQEAMGTGLPVITENKPAVVHLIHEGRNGWLHDGDLLSKVQEVLATFAGTNREDRDAVRQSVQLYNASFLSYETIAMEITKLVQE